MVRQSPHAMPCHAMRHNRARQDDRYAGVGTGAAATLSLFSRTDPAPSRGISAAAPLPLHPWSGMQDRTGQDRTGQD
jgi:hypothetical protein